MSDPRQHVRPGQKLQLAAQQINFLNALMRAGGGFGSSGLPGWSAGSNVIYGKNVGSSEAAQGKAQEITGIAISPSLSHTAERQFMEMPCVEFNYLTVPQSSGGYPVTQPTRICVPVEPIKAGKAGRVIVSGVTQVLYGGVTGGNTITDGNPPPFATPETGGIFRGTYNSSAVARVLWAGSQFAVIQLVESGNRMHFGKVPEDLGSWLPNVRMGVELYGNGPTEDSTGSVSVANTLFHPIAPGSWVVLWSAPDGDWYVVSAGKYDYDCHPTVVAGHDLSQLAGYSASTMQVLGHDEQGCLKWFSTTNCPP